MADQSDRFIKVVEEMRTRQKEYFRTRSPKSLQESKALESRVDAMLTTINKPNLFT